MAGPTVSRAFSLFSGRAGVKLGQQRDDAHTGQLVQLDRCLARKLLLRALDIVSHPQLFWSSN